MLDIFEILGPIMVGPSSSHTAGAVRIGRMARTLLGEPPVKADIGLYGSFAETGRGHGTDRALVAGLLGMKPDDLRIPESFSVAKEQGLSFVFHPAELREAHPNTALLELTGDRQVLIENHRGVTQYSREQVGVKVAFGEILLCGRELVLARMGQGQLVVTGCVESIRLLRRRCP